MRHLLLTSVNVEAAVLGVAICSPSQTTDQSTGIRKGLAGWGFHLEEALIKGKTLALVASIRI